MVGPGPGRPRVKPAWRRGACPVAPTNSHTLHATGRLRTRTRYMRRGCRDRDRAGAFTPGPPHRSVRAVLPHTAPTQLVRSGQSVGACQVVALEPAQAR